MSRSFLLDGQSNESLSKDELLTFLNTSTGYYKTWRYDVFLGFMKNFLFAIVNDAPIVLLDKDFSDAELDSLGFDSAFEEYVNVGVSTKLSDINDLISKIESSKSEISLFTSGTTGVPKSVVHTIKSLTRMVRRDESYQNQVWALCYNPTHMAGIQVLFQAVLNLNTIVYLFESDISLIEKKLLKENVTHISATPTFYKLLASSQIVYPQIKRVTLGGEKSTEKLYSLLQQCFPNAKFNNIYASTELGSLFVAKGQFFDVPAAIKEFIKISSENELLIHKSIAGRANVDDTWYATGDIVELIEKEPMRFSFLNRKSDLINVGGYMVNPSEVEEVLCKFENIVSARVFGKPNSVIGNILCAEIVSSGSASISIPEIQSDLRKQLQEFKIPRIIKVVETIEVTRTGKLSRK